MLESILFRRADSVRQILTLSLLLLLLTACAPPDYPADWPGPSSSFFSRKGGCPDLSGAYDGVKSELSWLLGDSPDFLSNTPRTAWFEHRAILTLSDDGDSLHVDLALNERGLPDFRTHMLRYNLGAEALRHTGRSFTLEKGRDYDCAGGWLYNKHFPQSERKHGWQQKTLQVGKDKSGGLIAGATINQDQSIGWGDSPGIKVGTADETRWYRWPARPPGADAELVRQQSFELRRYWWVNHGTRVATRMINYYQQPVCVRVTATYPGSKTVARYHPGKVRGKQFDACPPDWGQLGFGVTWNMEMSLPDAGGPQYRVEWQLPDQTQPRVIEVKDVRELPMMPRDKS